MNALLQGQGWHIVGWTMVYFLAAGTVVIIVGAVLRFALRTASPTLRYTTSLAVFATIAFLPVAIAILTASRGVLAPVQHSIFDPGQLISNATPLPMQVELKPMSSGADEKQALLPDGEANTSVETSPVPHVHRRDTVASLLTGAVEILPWVWIVGTPLTFLLLASGLVGAERLRKTSQPLDVGPIIETCETLRKALQVGRRVRVAVCERLATPLLVGIVRPLILLPSAVLTGWSQAELEMVLLHELAHVRRWDNLVNLVQRVVESLLFFHPAVWIASRWIRRDREDCCDAIVVSYTAKPQAYAELLLSLASPHPQSGLAASVAMARHPVAHRIRRILNLEDEPMLVSRKTLIAVATGVMSLLLTVAFVAPHSTDAEEPSAGEPKTKARHERQRPEEEEKSGLVDTEGTKDVESIADKVIEPGKTMVQLSPHPTTPAELNMLIRDIQTIQQRIFDAKNELVNLEVNRELQLSALTSPDAMKQDVDAALSADPTLQGYQQELDALSQQLRDLQAMTKSPSSPQIKRLQQSIAKVKEAEKQYREQSEKELTNEQKNAPNDAMKQMMTEYIMRRNALNQSILDMQNELDLKKDEIKVINKDEIEANPLFPTLEEQKAADVAYKLLHIELEKLSEEELQRVQAKGYRGGMRVQSTYEMGSLNTGDLLVGLHVWPTESLEQVNEILTRDDIDQLSPLKFYVIRKKTVDGGGNIGPLPVGPDQLVTGRIRVDLDAWRDLPAIKNETSRYNNGPILPQDSAASPYVNRYPTESKPGQQVQANTQLLYDDMTFDQWKNAWQNDLKTENRIECIKALAAFGRAGMAEEAAAAILDVAGQYDFYVIDDSPEGKLKEAVFELLTSNQRSRLSEKAWLPMLADRLEQEPERYRWLAWNLLSRLNSVDPATRNSLLGLQKNSDPLIRQAALQVILHAILPYDSALDTAQFLFAENERKNLYLEALESDPQTAAKLLSWQTAAWLKTEELLNLFLNDDEKIQAATRNSQNLGRLDDENAARLVEALSAVLRDQNRYEDHLAAVRALASLGSQAAESENLMNDIIQETEDEEMLIAALLAHEGMTKRQGVPMTNVAISEESKKLLQNNTHWKKLLDSNEQLRSKLYQETTKVFGQEQTGGGGLSGGGGFF